MWSQTYGYFCLDDAADVRGFADEGTALEILGLGDDTVLDAGPAETARDKGLLGAVCVGGEGEESGGVEGVGGSVGDVEVVGIEVVGDASGLPGDPVYDLHIIVIFIRAGEGERGVGVRLRWWRGSENLIICY